MELKGCVSHYEGLRTYVEWLFGDIVNNLKFSDFKKNLKICTRPEMIPEELLEWRGLTFHSRRC